MPPESPADPTASPSVPPLRFRPRRFPPPEFPPRRPALFARTPPAVFPAILGLIGLAGTLRAAASRLDLPPAIADLALGLVMPLWAFAAVALLAKILRRPSVVAEDLAAIPGRAGMAAATMGLMALSGLMAGVAPGAGRAMLFAGLALHGVVAVLTARAILRQPPGARGVTPVWHMGFAGFIVGGAAAPALGLPGLAMGLLWAVLPVAAAIWAVSLWQLATRIPPAPLRPLLAIHLAPSAFFASIAAQTGHEALAQGFALLAAAILLALVASLRWILAGPFTPLRAAFTFPLTAVATAALRVPGVWLPVGLTLAALASVVVPVIAWKVLRLWPQGRLAALTNAAEA